MLFSPAENVWVGKMEPPLSYLRMADSGSVPVPEGKKWMQQISDALSKCIKTSGFCNKYLSY